MSSGATSNYNLPYPLQTDPVNVAGDIQQLAAALDNNLKEIIEDVSASSWTGGTFNNGLNAPTYNDSTGKMSMSLSQDLQSSASPTFVRITSTQATGTAPFTVASTTVVTNLNADLLDGQHGSYYAPLDSPTFTGTVTAATLDLTTAATATAATSYWVETGSDGVVRPKTLANVKTEVVTTAAVNSASATVLGTVTSGVWNATAIAAAYGGTDQTSYTVGDILYASTTSALSKLAGVATGNALISGGVGTAPSWGKIGLTTHISGTLAVGNGGTGITSTPTNGQLLIGNGTNYTAAALTQGTGMSITNGSGSITLAVASVPNSQVIKFDTGTTEGTDLYTFNGSASKTIDIKAGTNITLTKSAGSITIDSTGGGGGAVGFEAIMLLAGM